LRLPVAASLLVLLSSLATFAQEPEVEQVSGAHGLSLPASFGGVLPCADCPGIRHHLDLWPEGGFALQREYLEQDRTDDVIGRWHVDPQRNALILSASEAPEWQILGNGHLRLLGSDGQPIDSELPYELAPGMLDPFDIAMPMTGEFVYFADAGLFTECMTGQRFPVLMQDGYIALEQAYLGAALPPQAPLLVRLDGRIAETEQMEGPSRRSLRVEQLHHVTPGGACATARAAADLVNTYWRIQEIGVHDLSAVTQHREPYLLLLPGEEPRFSATVGCNMMMGNYERDGDTLGFGPVAMTMMACPPELDELETAMRDMLGVVAGHDSDGHILRLRDEAGHVLARFQSVHTPHH